MIKRYITPYRHPITGRGIVKIVEERNTGIKTKRLQINNINLSIKIVTQKTIGYSKWLILTKYTKKRVEFLTFTEGGVGNSTLNYTKKDRI